MAKEPITRVYIKQDPWIMEAARFLDQGLVGTGESAKAARRTFQLYFSDFIEKELWAGGVSQQKAKTKMGRAAPDIITTEEEIRKTLTSSEGLESPAARGPTDLMTPDLKDQLRSLELKSKVGTSATTLTGMALSPADVKSIQGFMEGRQKKKEILEIYKKKKKELYDDDGNFLVGNLSGPALQNWVKKSRSKTAVKLREQIKVKANAGLEFNLKYDELKEGKKMKYGYHEPLTPKTDFSFYMRATEDRRGGTIEVTYTAAAKKKFKAVEFKLLQGAGKKVIPQFTKYLKGRYRSAKNPSESLKFLFDAVNTFDWKENLTPWVFTMITRILNPFYKGRVGNFFKAKKAQYTQTAPTARVTRPTQIISDAQLSLLLTRRLEQSLVMNMPRLPEPQRPIPRYITGRLATSFEILVKQKQNLLTFYNKAPANEYVNELNEKGWQLDRGLVEPTIRQMTQSLFGRQFQVIRTQ